jgi:cell division protein FtsB
VSPRAAARADRTDPEVETRRHGVLGALAAALPDRTGRRDRDTPDLRVVAPATRRRRGWQVGTIAGGLLFVALFAIAGAHTLIVQQQRHIDDVNGRIAEAEDRAEALEIELAELQSPERIVKEARDRLGMVQAPTPVYLQPKADDDARAAEVPPTTPPSTAPKATTPTTKATSGTSGTSATSKPTGTATSGVGTTPTSKATTPTTKATTSTTVKSSTATSGAGR